MKLQSKIKSFNDYIFKKIVTLFLEFYAIITNKRFFCRALKGDSLYNTVINSDLTISCNCIDNHGLGKVGNLKKQSLKEIFSGEKANQFRKSLAKGKLPIVNCVFCQDLCLINKKLAKKYIKDFNVPKGIMIENTVNCNLNCLSCNREKICSLRSKRNMSLEDIKKISLQIKQNKIKQISYFNLGEPFLSKEIKKELMIIRKDNPRIKIITSTNGTLLDSKEKRDAALFLDEVVFSISGSTQKSLLRYQKKGDFNKAYLNMKFLVELRESLKKTKPLVTWKYLLFRWNDSKKLIDNAILLAKKAKIDKTYFELTMYPFFGLSFKHYLGFGYLNRMARRNGKIYEINLNN